MSRAEDILAGLGGAANIQEIQPCITRIRAVVNDASAVDDDALRAVTHGVLRSDLVIQVIVGPEADSLASDIEKLR